MFHDMAVFQQHPDRAGIQSEAHSRPPMPIPQSTGEVWHWVLMEEPSEKAPWPDVFDPTARHQLIERDGGVIRFERHTEFVTIAFFGDREPSIETLDLIASCPGLQIAGARIVYSPKKYDPNLFDGTRVFGGEALFPGVSIASDFHVKANGLVTYCVTGDFDDEFARGRLVKRLLDLETYRMASLLALPLTRQFLPELEQLEKDAVSATDAISGGDDVLRAAIEELSSVLKSVARIKAKTSYRIAAAYAYDGIVATRIKGLKEKPIGQRATVGGFVELRLRPGMKSIAAFEARLDRVESSVANSLALARTQLDRATQQQSQALLESMEKRAREQVHLSSAVEGLSTAAITYYLVGLFGTALTAVPDVDLPIPLLKALSIPVIAGVVWWNVRRAKALIERL